MKIAHNTIPNKKLAGYFMNETLKDCILIIQDTFNAKSVKTLFKDIVFFCTKTY